MEKEWKQGEGNSFLSLKDCYERICALPTIDAYRVGPEAVAGTRQTDYIEAAGNLGIAVLAVYMSLKRSGFVLRRVPPGVEEGG
eukprot:CAMPEP_0119154304 /NCGR_PEP_ID=MMETSP1310-20130426/50600_1 /TAXON_ID=464262 /ORGANISM="Genus nov. species nov., Strain RCC2339" /LENGTH=83 /DNA_ID=CAMNT_0007146829 /DNA_START=29 /DNA_END=276 /DNA_ORIENTATION=+